MESKALGAFYSEVNSSQSQLEAARPPVFFPIGTVCPCNSDERI